MSHHGDWLQCGSTQSTSDLVGLNGGQVESLVSGFGIEAVAGVLFAGVFRRGLGEQLVDALAESETESIDPQKF